MVMGRPPKWKSPEELQKRVDAFFASGEIPTVMGLCLALDCDWSTLRDYSEKDDFSLIVARARQKILRHYEHVGQGSKGKGGASFADRMLTRMKIPAVEQSRQTSIVVERVDYSSVKDDDNDTADS
jgi:hypothetical protein